MIIRTIYKYIHTVTEGDGWHIKSRNDKFMKIVEKYKGVIVDDDDVIIRSIHDDDEFALKVLENYGNNDIAKFILDDYFEMKGTK